MKLDNFLTEELVPPDIYAARGKKALQLLDRELLIFIDTLRSTLKKPITINNWKWGGAFSQRGLRTLQSNVYSKYSQHTYGKALDFDVAGMNAGEVRQWIIDHHHLPWVKPVTFLEDGVNWVHVDTRPTDQDQLIVWHVKTGDTRCYP